MLLPYELPLRSAPITITNEGLSIELRLRALNNTSDKELFTPGTLFAALLDCPTPDFQEECWFLIYIKRTASRDRYARVRASRFSKVRLPSLPSPEDYRRILIRPESRGQLFETDKHYFTQLLCFRHGPPSDVYRLADAAHYPSGRKVKPIQADAWDLRSHCHADWTRVVVRRAPGRLTAALLFVRVRDGRRVLVSVGAYDRVRLGFNAVEMEGDNREAEAIPGPQAMQNAFAPTSVGSTVELPNHIVRVVIENSVHDMVKIHDVMVELLPKWPLESAALQAREDCTNVDKQCLPGLQEPQFSSPQAKATGTSKISVLDKLISSIPEGLITK